MLFGWDDRSNITKESILKLSSAELVLFGIIFRRLLRRNGISRKRFKNCVHPRHANIAKCLVKEKGYYPFEEQIKEFLDTLSNVEKVNKIIEWNTFCKDKLKEKGKEDRCSKVSDAIDEISNLDVVVLRPPELEKLLR
jgi:hypothetical protein